jgi:two-component system nitrogen regulation response regulator GlnG
LYHRLNVIRLRLPALRERREDVPALARHFLQRSAQQLGVEPKRMDDAALERLSHFQFPGNVRQLENICHWLTVMAPSQLIEVKDLPPEVLDMSGVSGVTVLPAALTGHDDDAFSTDVVATAGLDAATMVGASTGAAVWDAGLEQEALAMLNAGRTDVWDALTRRFETSLIQAALATTRGRRIEAAQKLGIGRNTITRKIQELGIDEI